MDYDLIVIGSGPAGYVAAIRAGQVGLKSRVPLTSAWSLFWLKTPVFRPPPQTWHTESSLSASFY